jgi:hypothetical protein
VLRQPDAQIRKHLVEDPQVGQPLLVLRELMDALGEGGLRQQLLAPLGPDPLDVLLCVQADQQGLEGVRLQAERRRGAGAHSAGRPDGVQHQIVLTPLEDPGQVVGLEQRRQVVVSGNRSVLPAPARGQLLHQQRAPRTVAPHHLVELGAPFRGEQLVHEGQARRRRGGSRHAIAGAPDGDRGRGRTALLALGRPHTIARRPRGVRRQVPVRRRAQRQLSLRGALRADPAGEVRQGERPQRPRGRWIGEEGGGRDELLPRQRAERSAHLGRARAPPSGGAPLNGPFDHFCREVCHDEAEPATTRVASQGRWAAGGQLRLLREQEVLAVAGCRALT